ncbi:PKD domain-containing protein [Spongiimicrobium sp. 3-5]|uniref:PKD domain-containing protein n=1 Tax=Spongiimicrobium sp. 3-5 TaxID=3332596 RepID=UPI0039808AF1
MIKNKTSHTWKIEALLIVLILLGACYEESFIEIKPGFETVFVNDDESVPVQLGISNNTEGADTFRWTFEGAQPPSSTDENPGTLVYSRPGTYSITLEASNVDGQRETVEKAITVYDAIAIDFSTEILESNYPPVEVALTNNTNGQGLSYQWSFEGGTPASSTNGEPVNVVFETPGNHAISLTVSNGFESFTDTKTISVAADILVDFDMEVAFFDDDYQAPVSVDLINNSISATGYEWTFEGGIPATSTEESPTVTFNDPGIHTIKLKVGNGKRTSEMVKTLEVLPNTNLRTFTDVALGINTAHNNNVKGAFFSTTLRQVFTADEVDATIGQEIDVVFFGLNDNFSFNKFISPNKAQTSGFAQIPNAGTTKFINSQELCGCGFTFSEAQFDAMIDDTPLQSLVIMETPGGLQQYNNTLIPRIVLFETQDGRKGAIKIKEYVFDGANSHIVCDVKVQKAGSW